MFCRKCGKKLPDDSVFCYVCGTAIEEVPEVKEEESTIEKKDAPPIKVHPVEPVAGFYGCEVVNGYKVNLLAMLQSNGSDISRAAKSLAEITGIPMDQAKDKMREAYKKYGPAPPIQQSMTPYQARPQNVTPYQATPQSVTPYQVRQNTVANRIAENRAQGIACCQKCGSSSITANKKGFGVGKAVIGAALVGPIGLIAGNAGAKNVRITCLNCGHSWKL